MVTVSKTEASLKEGSIIQITGSKSETNRLLILQSIYSNLSIINRSESDDANVIKRALSTNENVINVNHSGTAMRFLTALFTTKNKKEITITGSERMCKRPIGILVDALRNLGADITYLGEEGYPPLLIKGKNIEKKEVTIEASVSSQFISALLLIAPSLPNGLEIALKGNITSSPYIQLTLSLLKKIGVPVLSSERKIEIYNTNTIEDTAIEVESDWSSASYFYSLVALSEDLTITLKAYKKKSIQGDSSVASIYNQLGVLTTFDETKSSITISKKSMVLPAELNLNLIGTPDLAQTIGVTCFGLGIGCRLAGLHTLKIKETDRLLAMNEQLTKLGAAVTTSIDSLVIEPSNGITKNIIVDPQNDHRMAMAFAPLALLTTISFSSPNVVSKSYPTFWEDLKKVGVSVEFK